MPPDEGVRLDNNQRGTPIEYPAQERHQPRSEPGLLQCSQRPLCPVQLWLPSKRAFQFSPNGLI